MRRLLPILSAVILLASCEVRTITQFEATFDEDFFVEATPIEPKASGQGWDAGNGKLTFCLFTDAHIGREPTDDRVIERTDEAIKFLRENASDLAFCVSAGDLVDDGVFNEEVEEKIAALGEHVPFMTAIGNHELHDSWDAEEIEDIVSDHAVGTSGRFIWEDKGSGRTLSLYLLDSSRRSYGRTQLRALEKALGQDTADVKILVSHTNLTSGNQLDQSLFLFGTADAAERNRIYRLMDEYGAALMVTGHHHRGSGLMKHTSTMAEFNAKALHSSSSPFESEGRIYEIEIDFANLSGTITELDITNTGSVTGEWTFSLPSSS